MIRTTTLWGSAVRRLMLGLWVGGLAAIDLVETLVRFRTPELDRNQAVAVGRRVFAAVNRLEVCLGLVLLLMPHRTAQRTMDRHVGMMWSTALLQGVVLRPRMQQLAGSLDWVQRDRSDPRSMEVWRLHRVYVALDGLKLVLGMVALLRD